MVKVFEECIIKRKKLNQTVSISYLLRHKFNINQLQLLPVLEVGNNKLFIDRHQFFVMANIETNLSIKKMRDLAPLSVFR